MQLPMQCAPQFNIVRMNGGAPIQKGIIYHTIEASCVYRDVVILQYFLPHDVRYENQW